MLKIDGAQLNETCALGRAVENLLVEIDGDASQELNDAICLTGVLNRNLDKLHNDANRIMSREDESQLYDLPAITRLCETVYDITANAVKYGAFECVEDSRSFFETVFEWAKEFESMDFNGDYISAVDDFTEKKLTEWRERQ